MPDRPRQSGGGRRTLGDFAPKLDDVRNRPELSARDRSLVTVAVLAAGGDLAQLESHPGRAVENGVSREELVEAITHVTFSAGSPGGMGATGVAKRVLGTQEDGR